MPTQPQLWSMYGLSVELQIYREKLARDLVALPPDVEDETGKRWTMARVVEHLRQQTSGAKLDRTQEDARLKRAQAEKMEMELAQLRGEMVRVQDVGEFITGMAMAFRAKILAAPKRLAPVVLNMKKAGEIQTRIEKDLHQALDELSKLNPEDLRKEVRRKYKIAPDQGDTGDGE